MGIPIEPRLSNAALVKRQRLAALRRTRHAFRCVAPGQPTPYGICQQNLDNLISHALQHPPQSARLILVCKDLSTPVPVTSNTSSFIRLIPIFMRHARLARISSNISASRTHLADPSSRHTNSSNHPNSSHRAHVHRAASMRAAIARESRVTALLQFNRITAPYTSTTTPNQPLNASRRASASLQDIQPRVLYHHPTALHPSMHDIRHALRQSMLLIASANSPSRAQLWGRFHDPVASDTTTTNNNSSNNDISSNNNNSNHNRSNNEQDSPPDSQGPNARPRRATSTNSANRSRTNTLMSDKAISILYEVDTGCLWELGCWAGIQHLGRAGIFGILVEVLEKTSQVPGSPVEALCIRDNLFSYSTVRGGVRLLKELSGQLIDNYDRASNFFVHPMNDQRVQIIVSPQP